MKILAGIQADNFEEAAELVRDETGAGEISLETMKLFNSLIDRDKLHELSSKIIDHAIHDRYRSRKPIWHGRWWYVPLPYPGYDSRDVPQIEFEVSIYLVAGIKVETIGKFYSVTLMEVLGKPERLVIPLLFLQSVLDNNLDWIRVAACRPGQTIWEIPGIKPIPLLDKFLEQLEETLQRQSVVDWLRTFGEQGRRIAPLVYGAMLGMIYAHKTRPEVPLAQRSWSYEQLVNALVGMAYTTSESRDIVKRALPGLKPDLTLEEAIKVVLQIVGQGG